MVLYRELSGLPLCLYARLGDLAAAYSKANPVHCHLDYHGTKLVLPDIERVTPQVYRRIRDVAPNMLFAMMVGDVTFENSVFALRSRSGLAETLRVPGESVRPGDQGSCQRRQVATPA